MNEPSSYESFEQYDGMEPQGNPSLQPQLQQRPGTVPPGYRFSPDELRVLKECNQESFVQRSMPLGTMLGLGTYAAVQGGRLRPNPRFGAFPKVTLAVVLGYFIGKLSYQQACAEKLMALPGSYIGQLLREGKDGRMSPPVAKKSSLLGAKPGDVYTDAGPGSSLNLDTHHPSYTEDAHKPTNEGMKENLQAEPGAQQPLLSYDDLRRKNRGENLEAKQDPYRLDPRSVPPPVTRPRPVIPNTNQYGDVID